jgi:hypothetical protein
VEEFLLGGILAGDELHVVDHQHVDRTELPLESQRIAVAQRLDEPVHEVLGREVKDLAVRPAAAQVPADRVHQVRLAEPDTAIEEDGVERGVRIVRHAAGRGLGEFVRLADDKALEGEARVQRRGFEFV